MISAILLVGFGAYHVLYFGSAMLSLPPGQTYHEKISYELVHERAKSIALTAVYIAFLAVALYHATYGIRSSILEFTSGGKAGKAAVWILVAIAAITFIYGCYVVILSHLMAVGG
jgi:succinate dehydrogenase hydrophobic anchor subunit